MRIKALGLVQMGELSAGRAALEAAELAPGTNATLQQLQDLARQPPRAREPIPDHLLTEMPVAQFDMEEHKFPQNLRSARKGVAPGPSGMTCEHLRPLLENSRDSYSFFLMAEQFAQEVAPEAAIHAVRVGRLTVLRKPDGGVRGIVAGDVVDRQDNGSADTSTLCQLGLVASASPTCFRVQQSWMSPQQPCLLSDNSMATLPVTSGKMMKVLSMRLTRAKAGSRETHALAVVIVATRSVESRSAAVASWRAGFRLFG